MLRRRTGVLVAVLAVAVVCSSSSVFVPGGDASSLAGALMSAAGEGVATSICENGCTPVLVEDGTLSCVFCPPDKPSSGSFHILLSSAKTIPPNPCKVHAVSGAVTVTWGDSSTSTISVTGRFRDSKTLALDGTFPVSDANWSSYPMKVLLDGAPSDPCVSVTKAITGTFTIGNP